MSALHQTTSIESPGHGFPCEGVLLDSWLDHCSDSERKPIGLKGEPSYRYFWSTFVQYLKTGRNGTSEKAIAWHEVTPEDIAGFLNSGPSSRKRGTNVSDITRRRYWRLLERIYDHAMGKGWIASNRTLELPLLAASALQEWLAVRELYKHPEGGDALFCTNRRPTEKTEGMMTAITLLLLVREWITLAAHNVGEPVPARLGPQILRNTWIYKQLISGMPPNEVVLRAGLKNAKSFAHLRIHLPADIRLVIANARDDRV